MAALAENPELLRKIVYESDPHKGRYAVRFYDMNGEKNVRIDNYMPVGKVDEDTIGYDQPVMCYTEKPGLEPKDPKEPGEFIPFLIEKAWAKIHGSYCNVRQGCALTAL